MMRRTALLAVVLLVIGACSTDDATPTSTTAPASTTTTEPPTTTTTTVGLPDPLPSIPVGPDGIEYRGGGEDLELTGPSVLAVGPDGSVHVADPITARILSFWPDGTTSEIDLPSIDVLASVFIAAASDHLVVVEIFFAPLREKVHRIGYDGSIISSFQLPIAGRLETGLSGVFVDELDRIHLEIEGGVDYLQLDDATFAFTSLGSFTKHGVAVGRDGDLFAIGGVIAPADLVGQFGGLRLVDVAPDGTVVVLREDVVSMSPITVVSSVEWWSPAGEFLGSAPIALDEQVIDAPPGLAVGPDGSAVALYAREDVVEVVRLDRSPDRFTG